ncbi:hypothetical protein BAUCODRAFT_30204 [Baudoinia panamericana UAMH 10762]|uniref:Uncharacterized protein n=1 Tax=Baudoinia panamericana (strain UAMH 10762) TaxID=717646 RepID=M2LYL2_BAUPA|nr:uncharacterized protein BAUCODRAFT_30204 [Baudoinia panamericana UAMH 10762]EMC99797.1 hypothetical protein BAUCODRAFT_30204 [Baudoinia panamericana UAMH 10762]
MRNGFPSGATDQHFTRARMPGLCEALPLAALYTHACATTPMISGLPYRRRRRLHILAALGVICHQPCAVIEMSLRTGYCLLVSHDDSSRWDFDLWYGKPFRWCMLSPLLWLQTIVRGSLLLMAAYLRLLNYAQR